MFHDRNPFLSNKHTCRRRDRISPVCGGGKFLHFVPRRRNDWVKLALRPPWLNPETTRGAYWICAGEKTITPPPRVKERRRETPFSTRPHVRVINYLQAFFLCLVVTLVIRGAAANSSPNWLSLVHASNLFVQRPYNNIILSQKMTANTPSNPTTFWKWIFFFWSQGEIVKGAFYWTQ